METHIFTVLREEVELFCRYCHCYTNIITLLAKFKIRGCCSLSRICIGNALLIDELFSFSTDLISVFLDQKEQRFLAVTRNIKAEAFIPKGNGEREAQSP